jgi:IS5 family transposase
MKERTREGYSRARRARNALERGVFEGMRRSRAREKGKRDGRTWWKGRENNTVRRKMPGFLYLSQCLRGRDRVSLPLVLLWYQQCKVKLNGEPCKVFKSAVAD